MPSSPCGGRGKAGRVYELCLGLVGVGVAASHSVWAVEVVAIAAGVEGDSGIVHAVEKGEGKARGDSFDQCQLPSAQNRVGRVAPTVAELLAPAEGQVVDHTGYKVMMEVDLGRSPIELLPIGKREKRRTHLGA